MPLTGNQTPIFAELATNMAENGRSRDDERAADEAGIAYMRRAPRGSASPTEIIRNGSAPQGRTEAAL